jgi:hypothetical protein
MNCEKKFAATYNCLVDFHTDIQCVGIGILLRLQNKMFEDKLLVADSSAVTIYSKRKCFFPRP